MKQWLHFTLFCPEIGAFLEVIMTNRDFVKTERRLKDRFHNDYQLTHSEIQFALLCTFILIIGGLFGFFYWILQITTS